MKAIYDHEPQRLEAVGDGSFLYRYNIAEEQVREDDDNTRTQWACQEVRVWPPITANRITEAAIRDRWTQAEELKLLNDFNGLALNLCADEDEAGRKAERYQAYLAERKTLKETIDNDCQELNIE